MVLAPGRQSYFLMITQRGASLLMMQGMLDSTWAAQSIGLGEEAQVEMMVSTVQEGHQAIADAIIEKRIKARGPGCPQGTTKTNQTPQQHTTLKSGCEAWRKMLLKLSWEITKWIIVGLSGRMLILSIWVEVEDGVEDKAPHNYWETLLWISLFRRREFRSGKWAEFPSINHD